MNTTVLMVPGWQDSGPLHWQTLWEQQNPAFKRVLQTDWQTPKRRDWVNNITHAVMQATSPVDITLPDLAFFGQKDAAQVPDVATCAALRGILHFRNSNSWCTQ